MSELDVKAALLANYNQIDPAVLYQRAIDYLTSSGGNTDGLLSVDRSTVEFYDDYGLFITDFSYGDGTKTMNDMAVHQQTYVNRSPDDPLEGTFTYTLTRQDSQTFKFTEGLKIGAKASFKAGLPVLAEGKVEVSGEISFSAEQTLATTTTTTWQFAEKVTVKPLTAVQATGFLRFAEMDMPFTCNVSVNSGKVLVWFQTTNGYTETPIPVTDMMAIEERTFVLSGQFNGSEGDETYVQVDPLANAAAA